MELRQSVRALILDEADRVLLVRFRWPIATGFAEFWANPGGGVNPGESHLSAMRRELLEEVGITIDSLGPKLWEKTAMFDIEGFAGQVDHIYLQRVKHFDPHPAFTRDELRREHVHGSRWWSLDEIAASTADFAPRTLAKLLASLLRDGPPKKPLELTGF